ncbi:diacylglycerol/lipid kinase family protein [Falsibacillus albus]|uniref:diacylglycerol/lipid kinase family protein n=1 Tax=Falsibacillus albus TaxID=2478915 RepID=UPI001314E6F2|nr:diacylglycerol kinase family protein [Falsibacillus albus]
MHFIVNPKAKNGLSKKIWNEVKTKLTGLNYQVHFTEFPKHATQIAEQIGCTATKETILIVVGGDGTMNEVINGAIPFPLIRIAYIPAGSGNDFARGFHLPATPQESTERILTVLGQSGTYYDAGYFQNKDTPHGYFVNSIGAGFDAQISLSANRSIIKKWLNKASMGNMVYAFYLIKELFTYKPGLCEISIDGEKYQFTKTWFITISNHPYYGGGMKISPTADPGDGKLNITVVDRLSKLKLLAVFISVFWGGHTRFKEVKTFQGEKIDIDFKGLIPVHADGEYIGSTPVHIEVKPKSWIIL